MKVKISPLISLWLFGFAVLLVCRFLLWQLLPDRWNEVSSESLGLIWSTGLRFDAVVLALVLALPTLLYLLSTRRVLRQVALCIAWLSIWLSALLLIADGVYLNLAGSHIGWEFWAFAAESSEFVFDMLSAGYWLHGMIWLLLFTATSVFYFRYLSRLQEVRQALGARLLCALLWLLLIAFCARGGLLQGKPLAPIDAYIAGSDQHAMLALNGIFTIAHGYDSQGLPEVATLNSKEQQQILGGFESWGIEKPSQQDDLNYLYQRPNVVVLLVESLASQYLDSFSGQKSGFTPHLDRLAHEGEAFRSFYAAGTRSIEAMQVLLTGAPLIPQAPLVGSGLENYSVQKLGLIAQQAGYRGLFAQSSKRRSFRLDAITRLAGFEYYLGQEDYPVDPRYPRTAPFGWDHEGLQVFSHHLEQIHRTGKPFLGVYFTGTLHEPYTPIPGSRETVADRFSPAAYQEVLAYTDRSIGDFMHKLQSNAWGKNTVVFILADHTPGLVRKSEEESFRIPLIVWPKGALGQIQDHAMLSQYDLLPTIAGLMGHPAIATSGRPIGSGQARNWVITRNGEKLSLIQNNRLQGSWQHGQQSKSLAEQALQLYVSQSIHSLTQTRGNP